MNAKNNCPHEDNIDYLRLVNNQQHVQCTTCGALGVITVLPNELNEADEPIEVSEEWGPPQKDWDE